MIKSIKYSKSPDKNTSKELLSLISTKDINLAPRKIDKELVIYGAGNLGRMAREYLDKIGVKIAFIVDKEAEKYNSDSYWAGLKIINPENVNEQLRENTLLAVSVVTTPFVELAATLYSEGWKDIVPFYDISEAYRDRHPLSNGWFADPFNSEDIKNISDALDIWDDDISRAHHLQFIAWRRLREEWMFDDAVVTNENRYFIPEIVNVLTDHECFVDVGAHTGSVVTKILKVINNKFKKISAIEPDSSNLPALNSMLRTMPDIIRAKVEVIDAVISANNEQKKFYDGLGYASQICDFGKEQVDLTTLDELNLAPTFIKLHIEGWELDALDGAKQTIKKCRPIITSTIYHNKLGLWEIPQWFMGNLLDYKLIVRAHSWCGTGLVIYAIPNERVNIS